MRPLLALLLLAPALAGCLASDVAPGPGGFAATVRWTDYGIPHVQARDWRGLGYGQGFAQARDNVCILAEEYLTVRGERSLHFPPEDTYLVHANGAVLSNEQSDAFFRLLRANHDLIAPQRLRPELRDLQEGFAAGYDRWLADHAPPPECRGAARVRPITTEDLAWRVAKLQLLASSGFFAAGMVQAHPPLGGAPLAMPRADLGALREAMGSNAYALGRDATADGAGMLLGNPHYPWQGPERFHQVHLTIPGQLDVMGASILGVPGVVIGFTEHFAWSHTVSTAWRFTLHELTLAPGRPTAYVVDGAVEEMERREVRVPVRLPSGEVEERTRGLWLTRWGPVVTLDLAGLGVADVGLAWDGIHAYALQDANAPNDRLLEQFFRFDAARSFDEFRASVSEVLGIPWVNTIAASPDGRALYADIGVVPNVSGEALEACNTALGRATFAAARLPVLDGSRAACDWAQDPRAPQEGIIPAEELPSLVRSDWVLNSNDSHWLPHPESPLEGFSPMVGDERRERSLRTRMGYQLLGERLAGAADCGVEAHVPCDRFTLARLQQALFSSRLLAAELARDAVVRDACALPLGLTLQGPEDLGPACAALRPWDLRANADSRGAALFELFWLRAPRTWATPFDAADPVGTPRDYLALDPRVRQALAEAARLLDSAGLAPDVATGEARFVERGGERIPLHGAHSLLGSPSFLILPFVEGEGFAEPVHGNSYIQTVTWDGHGVQAEALLSYSQSSSDASPHRADQTRLYSAKEWVRLPFREADVAAATLETLRLRG